MKNPIHILTLMFSIFVLTYFLFFTDDATYKQRIHSIDLAQEDVILRKVNTIPSPVLEPNTLAQDLKFKINNFYSFRLDNIKKHLDENELFFGEDFYDHYRKVITSRASALISKDVRVVDFIITQGPIYLGSSRYGKANWTFYIKGFSSYDGLFSSDRKMTAGKELFVTLEEDRSVDGNPSGVKIVKVIEM